MVSEAEDEEAMLATIAPVAATLSKAFETEYLEECERQAPATPQPDVSGT